MFIIQFCLNKWCINRNYNIVFSFIIFSVNVLLLNVKIDKIFSSIIEHFKIGSFTFKIILVFM